MCKYRLDFSKNSFCLVIYVVFLEVFLKLFFCINISWCSWLGLSKCTFLSKLLFYIKLLESHRIFIHDYCSRLELIELSLHRLEYSPPYCAIWPLNLSLLWFFLLKVLVIGIKVNSREKNKIKDLCNAESALQLKIHTISMFWKWNWKN